MGERHAYVQEVRRATVGVGRKDVATDTDPVYRNRGVHRGVSDFFSPDLILFCKLSIRIHSGTLPITQAIRLLFDSA